MVLTITLILSVLVAFNFFLLAFSCNKSNVKSVSKPPKVLISETRVTATNQSFSEQLAPTGS